MVMVMVMLLAFVLTAVLFQYVHCINQDREEECPVLFTPTDLGCKCGFSIEEDSLNFLSAKRHIKCDFSANSTSAAYLYVSFCMSYNEADDTITLGGCPYNSCARRHGSQCTGRGKRRVKIPRDRLQINDVMCSAINRIGLLCSKCAGNLGPAVFHYGMPCVTCLGNVRGWLLYLTSAFTFPTLFFVLLIIFQIHISSCALDNIVLICQILLSQINRTPWIITDVEPFHSLQLLVLTVSGIWNLDFFRYCIPPFCINESMTALQVVSLEYLVAIYPLFLTALTYVLIELHDRDCRVLVLIWRPFHRCLTHFNRQWSPKGDIIHAFASFFLLSYIKIAFISVTLLHNTSMYDESFKQVPKLVVYADPAIQFFSVQHAPMLL